MIANCNFFKVVVMLNLPGLVRIRFMLLVSYLNKIFTCFCLCCTCESIGQLYICWFNILFPKKVDFCYNSNSPLLIQYFYLSEKENLCLYGFPSEQWEVNLPAEEVPPELPEPALGINFARDGMQEKEWLALVAVHSDVWLLSVAFYFGSRFGFDKSDRFSFSFIWYLGQFIRFLQITLCLILIIFGCRKRLFNMINELPTIFEVVSGNVKKQTKEKSSITNHGSNKSKSSSKAVRDLFCIFLNCLFKYCFQIFLT